MPVAFHPPLEHPIDPPHAARGNEDTANGELFAALLAGAGKAPDAAYTAAKLPSVAGAVGKAPVVEGIAGNVPAIAYTAGNASAAATAADSEPDDDRRTDTTAAALFDPLNLFAAWPGAELAAGAARDVDATASARETVDTAFSRTARRTGGATDPTALAPAITARDSTPDAVETAGNGTSKPRAASARRLSTAQAHDLGAARPAPGDTAAASGRGVSAPTAELTTAFAAAAALLARAPDDKIAGGTGTSAVDRADAADATPGVNPGTPAATATVSLARPIAEPVGSPGFATQVAGEIAQLVHINADRAQLHVHPADMGPIEVTMSVRHDQVSVTMIAADPQTRAALELALPQLRDLLANQGLALANASVNDHAPRDDSRQRSARSSGAGDAAITGVDAVAVAHAPASVAIRRLVDLYA